VSFINRVKLLIDGTLKVLFRAGDRMAVLEKRKNSRRRKKVKWAGRGRPALPG
jgi:hypothetical protein